MGIAATFGRIPFDERLVGNSHIKAGVLAATSTDAALAMSILCADPPRRHFYTQLYNGGDVEKFPSFELEGDLPDTENHSRIYVLGF